MVAGREGAWEPLSPHHRDSRDHQRYYWKMQPIIVASIITAAIIAEQLSIKPSKL